jgi:hypothetical protein
MNSDTLAAQVLVPYVNAPFNGPLLDMEGLSEAYRINHVLWNALAYKPDVFFNIGYSGDAIFLRFSVTERDIKADCLQINDAVYNDSCVEFFVGFDNEDQYYNLEFNRLGIVLGAFGAGRFNRQSIDVSKLAAIGKQYDLKPVQTDSGLLYSWRLALTIPFTVFEHHQITRLDGCLGHCNFFKCGDGLPEPHFLSWRPVYNPVPDFHLPQFFGTIKFKIPDK